MASNPPEDLSKLSGLLHTTGASPPGGIAATYPHLANCSAIRVDSASISSSVMFAKSETAASTVNTSDVFPVGIEETQGLGAMLRCRHNRAPSTSRGIPFLWSLQTWPQVMPRAEASFRCVMAILFPESKRRKHSRRSLKMPKPQGATPAEAFAPPGGNRISKTPENTGFGCHSLTRRAHFQFISPKSIRHLPIK